MPDETSGVVAVVAVIALSVFLVIGAALAVFEAVVWALS